MISDIIFSVKKSIILQNDINHIIFESINSAIYFVDDVIVFELINIEWIKSIKVFIIYISSFFTVSVLKKYNNAVSRSEEVDEY